MNSSYALTTNISKEKNVLAKQLVAIDGSTQSMQEANKVVIQQMKQNLPYAPNGFFTRLQQRFNQVDYNSQFANIYAETLTDEELKKLIELYSSPVGKSIASKTGGLSKKLAEQQAEITQDIIQKTAQEFGHFILHSKKGSILKENEILHFLRFYNDKINLEAHYFAKGLLLPTDLFKLKAEEFDNNIFELANYFKVSTQLINQRFEDFFDMNK